MKKTIFTILFICISMSSFAQMYELGFFAGGSNFVGEIGATDYLKPNRPSFGVVYKYNINPRMALRANYNYYNIYGDDMESDNEFRNRRGLNFENNLNEFAVGLEYNFFEYEISTAGKRGTPYLLFQLGIVDYKTPRATRLNGETVFTRNTSMTIPMGIGYKSVIYGKLAFAIEARANYTLTDNIDFTTANVPSINLGSDSDDWYMFTGISLVYTFGRPACYANGRR